MLNANCGRMSVARVLAVILAVLGITLLAGPARAQCTPQWQPFDASTAAFPGTNGTVLATVMWDPDGAGPITPKLVVGGSFSIAGNAVAANIVVYDEATGNWSALGSGVTGGTVNALAVLPSGDLIAGGTFASAGGVAASRIARWNGSSWSALGSGVAGGVLALAVFPSGELIAGGGFTTAGGVAANRIARWNGSSWSALGSGVNSTVYALAVLPSGEVVAGGDFTTAGGVSASRIARWNGASWSALGSGLNGSARALAVLPNGDLIAGGGFTSTTAGDLWANRIARWNDSQGWTALGAGVNNDVVALAVLPGGELFAGGGFLTAGSVPANRIARWDDSQGWTALGAGVNNDVLALALLPGGDLIAGGSFTTAGGVPASSIARWNGSQGWSALASGMNSAVLALSMLPGGDLIAGGVFTTAGVVPASLIASWNGASWSALGSAVREGFNGDGWVGTLAVLPGGSLIVGGNFRIVNPAQQNVDGENVASWNGSSWFSLGSQGSLGVVRRQISALAVLSSGEVIAGGNFQTNFFPHEPGLSIARWNGSMWLRLGSGLNGSVFALAVLPNGDLIAGGSFTIAGGVPASGIARWNGATWSALGSGVSDAITGGGWVGTLAVLPSGEVIAGGSFTTAGGLPANNIARWNGSSWSPLGSGVARGVLALTVLPNGDLIAGGGFTTAGDVAANRIARWNGSSWSALGSGVNNDVYALAVLPSGDLVAGGVFTAAGSVVAPYLARYTGVVPAVAVQPLPQSAAAGQTLAISATTTSAVTGVFVQWQRNGVNMTNGPFGASPGGGTVSGASGPLPSGTPAMLTITNAQASDGGEYTAIFSNACGSITTAAAIVTITGPTRCNAADIANDTGQPIHNFTIAPDPLVPNNGITEGDYNVFFANFFDAVNVTDIADDQGIPLPPFGLGGVAPNVNNGVTEGDYNLFFSIFFEGCAL